MKILKFLATFPSEYAFVSHFLLKHGEQAWLGELHGRFPHHSDFPLLLSRPHSRSAEIASEEPHLTVQGNLSSESFSWQRADLGRSKSQRCWRERKMSHGQATDHLLWRKHGIGKKKKKKVFGEN